MTEEQKDILITRMLECPAELTDAEVMQILEDDELRDVYSIFVDLKAAKNCQTEIDASAEWRRFMPRLVKTHRWNVGLLSRVAAILVGVLLATAGIFFLTNNKTSNEKPKFAQNEVPVYQRFDIVNAPPTDTIAAEEPQGGQASCLHNAIASNAATPEQRAGRMPALLEQTLDVEEYVRIQQARMDNDLAMERAEAIVNQYYAMADVIYAMQSDLGDGYSMEDEIVTLIIP